MIQETQANTRIKPFKRQEGAECRARVSVITGAEEAVPKERDSKLHGEERQLSWGSGNEPTWSWLHKQPKYDRKS